MNKNNTHNRRGVSLIEAMVVIAAMVIVVLGVSAVLERNQRQWNEMYNRAYSDVFVGGRNAKKMFDSIVRKSSEDNLQIGNDCNWIVAYYYADDASAQLDRYTQFFYLSGALYVKHGETNPWTQLSTHLVCDDVTQCVFRKSGRSVYMFLTIGDGEQTQTIGTAVEMQN